MSAISSRFILFSFAFSLGLLGSALLAPGLARADVPQPPDTVFAQVGSCKMAYDGVRGVHDFSVRTGRVLWTCGDVPGVTGADMGQEYCDYQAVSGGRVIRNVRDIAPGGSLQCVFTTVFSDSASDDTKLLDALALPENLGARPDTPSLVRMTRPDNSRQTAQSVLQNCSADDAGAAAAKTDEIRQVACFQALLKQPDSAASEKLKQICRGQDLSQETQWAKAAAMGAKVLAQGDQGYDEQRDIASCVATKRLKGGLAWRNSDMRLCARARRASEDCGCSYDIPAAVDGFALSGWTNPLLGAVGCRKAKVDGKEYDHIVICDINPAVISDIELNFDLAENLPRFCIEEFKNVLPVRADIRSFQKAGSCNDKAAPFCAAQAGTAP